MTEYTPQDVDTYLERLLLDSDEALQEAARASAAAGLPNIAVSPLQGKLLELLARSAGARRILEIGTLGGYSTIALARAVGAEGRVITLEYEPRHADVARANLAHAGLADRVDVVVGAALDTLPDVAARADGASFDLVFIDADKENNPAYLQWALRLTRPGSVIIVDNVVRDGQVAGHDDDPLLVGTRQALELLGSDDRLDATAIQTVGAKHWDGFAYGVVR